jgi:hypothetical protein
MCVHITKETSQSISSPNLITSGSLGHPRDGRVLFYLFFLKTKNSRYLLSLVSAQKRRRKGKIFIRFYSIAQVRPANFAGLTCACKVLQLFFSSRRS